MRAAAVALCVLSIAASVGASPVAAQPAADAQSPTRAAKSPSTEHEHIVEWSRGVATVKVQCAAEHAKLCGKEAEPGKAPDPNVRCLLGALGRDDSTIGAECASALKAVRALMAAEPTLDDALMKACAEPLAHGPCSRGADDGTRSSLSALRCLKVTRRSLPEACRAEVTRVLLDESRDLALDVMLYRACAAEISEHCAASGVGGGRRRACLEHLHVYQPKSVGASCAKALASSGQVRADDVRFHEPVVRACSAERRKFCHDTPAGDARVLSCLAEHSSHPEMGPSCAAAISHYQAVASSDFRLDARVLHACRSDIIEKCGNVTLGGGKVLNCLVSKEEELASAECRREVHRVGETVTSDVRLNQPVRESCAAEIGEGGVCAGVPPGGGAVFECLKGNFTRLAGGCALSVRGLMQVQARDVHYHWPLRAACSEELESKELCGADAHHEPGEQMRCLMTKRDDPKFTPRCRRIVVFTLRRQVSDIHQMVSLKRSCADDLAALCNYDPRADESDFKARVERMRARRTKDGGAGAAEPPKKKDDAVEYYACLREHGEQIRSVECAVRVEELHVAIAEDAALNAPLHKACAADIAKHCKRHEGRGGGLLLRCLGRVARVAQRRAEREHLRLPAPAGADNVEVSLSKECASEVVGQMGFELSKPELNAPLRAVCGPELARFCAPALSAPRGDVLRREGQGMACLQEHAHDEGFGKECAAHVAELTKAQLSDVRYDRRLYSACRAPLRRLCADVRIDADGAALACLQQHRKDIGERACSEELDRASRVQTLFPSANIKLIVLCRAQFEQVCSDGNGALLADKELLVCLREKRDRLHGGCAAKAVSMERMAHREMTYNAELRVSCGDELRTLCAAKAPSEQFDCLANAAADQGKLRPRMGAKCRRTVDVYRQRSVQSLELMPSLQDKCKEDYALLCAGATALAMPGAALACLRDSVRQLTSEQCRAAVQDAVRVASADARMDPMIMHHCKAAVTECTRGGARGGRGEINACLRAKMTNTSDPRAAALINPGCRQQIFKLVQLEIGDVSLSYPVSRACGAEMRRYCANADTADAEGLACLESHVSDAGFSARCAAKVKESVRAATDDYRLLPKVSRECEAPVRSQCAHIEPGGAAVLHCLLRLEVADNLTFACGFAVRHAARLAFRSFRWGQGLTRECDADIYSECVQRALPTSRFHPVAMRRGGPPAHNINDIDGDGELRGTEIWPCLCRASYDTTVFFHSSYCRDVVKLLAPDPNTDAGAMETLSVEMRAQHTSLLKRQREMYMKFSKAAGPSAGGVLPPRASAAAPAGMTDAEKAEFDRLKSEAAHKGIELQRLHEQLAFVEEVNAANKRLLDDHHRAAASGYFISHRASALLILGALGAAVYAMRRSHLRRQKLKGYEVLVVSKDG